MIQSQALEILKTGVNVFLTGEPGAGKTYTINQYISYLRSLSIEPAITASTGIAATHIGGMTIHSWSGIGIRSKLTPRDVKNISSSKYIHDRIKKARVLIIEEVSMLLPETLTMVNQICQDIKDSPLPFGGIQVIFVGDFFQLPPVQKKPIPEFTTEQTLFDTEEITQPLFAFDSDAWKAADPYVCYLTDQYRQDAGEYLNFLNAIRRNELNETHMEVLQLRKTSLDAIPENVPKLYSRNMAVDTTNQVILSKIKEKEHVFLMKTEGIPAIITSLKNGCLSPDKLVLKVGATVMFTKNNPKEGFVNGTLGVVEGFNSENGNPYVRTRNNKKIEVKPMDWSISENDKLLAQIVQLPLRLAWAITVHKSQGMSLDEAVIDLSDAFEYGQGYVALSRVRSLSGLYILGWNTKTFEVHPDILEKDYEFRRSSQESEKLFESTTKEDLITKQDSFISVAGGKKIKSGNQNTNIKKVDAYEEVRKKYRNAYMPWSEEDDRTLRQMFLDGASESKLVKAFGRGKGAIQSRLVKLGLLENLF